MSKPEDGTDCIFCALYAGSIEASVVFRNERAMAAMTIRPTHVGHVLLFPKAHVEDFALLDAASLGSLFHLAARLKLAICEATECEGFQLQINQGEATGQKRNCRHLHIHLIPCSMNGSPKVEGRPADSPRSELDEAARRIARKLDGLASWKPNSADGEGPIG